VKRILARFVAGATLLVLSGCGVSIGSRHAATTTATTAATPVPADLINYARNVTPVLTNGIDEAKKLRATFDTSSMSDVGNACSTYGDTLANNRGAFTAASAPSGATKLYKDTLKGYKLILGAVIECGMASDSNSSSQLNTSASDLDTGISLLSSVQSSLSGWSSAKP
jgi:hypothetical protein